MVDMEDSRTVRSPRRRAPTDRQDDFAVVYIETGNAAEAAREAGYRGRFAAQAGYKLLNRPGTVDVAAHDLSGVHPAPPPSFRESIGPPGGESPAPR